MWKSHGGKIWPIKLIEFMVPLPGMKSTASMDPIFNWKDFAWGRAVVVAFVGELCATLFYGWNLELYFKRW